MSAPAAIPNALATLIEREVRQALRTPGLEQRFRSQGYEITATTGSEAKARLKAEREQWAEVIKAADIRVD
jgi:tripartite-type tricarboxylate transporter receptor subunit TctC